MFHVASSVFGGLAVVAAWALVAPGESADKKTDAATAVSVNRAAKSDRLLPRLTVREMSRSKPTPIDVPRDLKALRIGCDPMVSPVAQPELAHLTGRCLTQRDDGGARVSRDG